MRNLDDAVIDALKQRAAAHNRSLEGELRQILTEAAFSATSPRGGKKRKLRLKTVTVGADTAYRREEIYGSDEGR